MSEQWGDRGIDWEPMVSQREHVIKGGGEYRCLVCETRCGEDGHCRCCLAAEAEALRAQVAAVRKLLNVWGPREATDETHRMYKELQAALDGPA